VRDSFKNAWELLRPHLAPRIPALALVFLLGAITAAAQASSIGLFVGVWNLIFGDEGETTAAAVPGVEDENRFLGDAFDRLAEFSRASGPFEDWRSSMLLWFSAIALVLAIVAGMSEWGYTYVSRRVAFRMIVDLRVRIARHLMGLSMRYHGARRFGDLLSRISSDVTLTLSAVNLAMRGLILEPILALAVLAFMMWAAPWITVGILVALPLALVPVALLTRKVKRGSRRSMNSLGASVQALTQMFQGVRTVKSFGGEERELERYRRLNEGYMRSSMKMVRAIALSHSWSAFYSIAGIGVLVLVVGVIQLTWHPFESGGVVVGLMVWVARLSNHVKDTTKAITKFSEAAGACERINELLAESVDVQEADEPEPISALGDGIRFEGVTFLYPEGEAPAIRDLDLAIRPGETLALVGPSGAGKSTLVDLVARFVDPSEGRIVVGGHDLRRVKLADWTALYAMVSQSPFLFHSTIGENIAYGRDGATQVEVEAAARSADIHDFILSLPDGYETNVADMGTRLSGGQRQRITIARALLKGAPLLLLDEATSALDSESEGEVQRALERLMKDRTVIVIAHRLATIRNADRIAVLERGRLVELGTHGSLLANGGTYARLHALQNTGS